MDLVYFSIAIFLLVWVTLILIAIFVATKLSPQRVALGPVNPPAGPPAPPAPPPGAPTPPPAPAPAPAPAGPTATTRSYWPSWNFSWVRSGASYATSTFAGTNVLFVLVAVAAVATGLWLLQQPGLVNPSTTAPPLLTISGGGKLFEDTWSVGLGVVAIAMLLFAFWVGDRPKLVTFLYVTILVLLVYYLYKQGMLDIGQRRNILYILAIAAAILVLKYATKFSERLTFGILVAALFTMLGFSHLYSWNQFTNLFGWPSWGSSRVAYVSPNTTRECDGKLTVYEYSPGKFYRVNSPVCQLRAYVMSGCVTWHDSTERQLGRTCNGPLPTVPGVELMRADSVAVVRINHCKPYAPGNLADTCS